MFVINSEKETISIIFPIQWEHHIAALEEHLIGNIKPLFDVAKSIHLPSTPYTSAMLSSNPFIFEAITIRLDYTNSFYNLLMGLI